jgi:type I restriction enzyme M protein
MKKNKEVELITIGELELKKYIDVFKGVDPKISSYESGAIPYIRTSDIVNYEINLDTPISVERDEYNRLCERRKYFSGDILFVNDGRYRIGNNCILNEYTTEIVVQSHIKVIRIHQSDYIDPYLLLYLLNSPLVKEQIQHKTFIQSTIATLGNRLREIILPIPLNQNRKKEISEKMRNLVLTRGDSYNQMTELFGQDYLIESS